MVDNVGDAVIKLHEIARFVEKQFGAGVLSDDIRKAASRLDQLDKPYMKEEFKDGGLL